MSEVSVQSNKKENEENEEKIRSEENEIKKENELIEDKEEYDKKVIEKEIKEIAKNILIKYLDGREYEKEKLPKWTELILHDSCIELKKKYKNMLMVYFFISQKKRVI